MLAGVLLHVVAAAVGVNDAVNTCSRFKPARGFDEVHDGAVFTFGHFNDAELAMLVNSLGKQPSSVKDLPTAGGIESGPVERDCRTRVCLIDIHHFSVEFVKKRIGVVEALGHGYFLRSVRMGLTIKCIDSSPSLRSGSE